MLLQPLTEKRRRTNNSSCPTDIIERFYGALGELETYGALQRKVCVQPHDPIDNLIAEITSCITALHNIGEPTPAIDITELPNEFVTAMWCHPNLKQPIQQMRLKAELIAKWGSRAERRQRLKHIVS
ncbi:MAG: hypothetical protein K9M03_02740 [Kiritimatiellales bacterium]|nr:hypothetical protein [Kiritimatiellales bacterium]